MTVYVDSARNAFGRMQTCHMLADTEQELHAFAERLGLKREWYQPLSTPHYDISHSKRAVALMLGAIEADKHKVVELIHTYRARKAQAESDEA